MARIADPAHWEEFAPRYFLLLAPGYPWEEGGDEDDDDGPLILVEVSLQEWSGTWERSLYYLIEE